MFVSFETTSSSKYSTWCQKCIFLHIPKHPECFYSRITVLPVLQKREEDRSRSPEQFYLAEYSFYAAARFSKLSKFSKHHPVHSFPCLQAFYTAESSFRAAPSIPCTVSRVSKHSTRQNLHSMQPEVSSSSLWSSRVAVEEEF